VSGHASDPIPYRELAGLALLVAALIPDRKVDNIPVLCPFRRATGLPCPTCGLTRSWVALLHGRVRASVGLHPLGAPTAAAAMLFAAGYQERVPGLAPRLQSRALIGAAAGAWVVVWLMRLRAARG
jgi:Protein of unknown function (DUF2752)